MLLSLWAWSLIVKFSTGSALNCGHGDWSNVGRSSDIECDSDDLSLQIQTQLITEKNDLLSLYLIDEGETFDPDKGADTENPNRQTLRFIEIRYSDPMKYLIGHCSSKDLETMTEFDELPPSDRDDLIWTIFKSNTQLLIRCNGALVLTLAFNDSSIGDCRERWHKQFKKIRFSTRDTASKCYRKIRTCSFKPNVGDTAHPKLVPGTVLPILAGAIVTLYCDHDWFTLTGDDTLTCNSSGDLTPETHPTCTRDLAMTCTPVYVKQGRSATLEAVLSKATTWEREIWDIEGYNTSSIVGSEIAGQVLEYKTTKMETVGVYGYKVIIQKQGSHQSCDGTILVYIAASLPCLKVLMLIYLWNLLLSASLGSAITCGQEGWSNGNKENIIQWDAGAHTLQIKTKSPTTTHDLLSLYLIGEGEKVFMDDVQYENHNRGLLRLIEIEFSDPMMYLIGHCSSAGLEKRTEFEIPPPSDSNKIWTISKSDTQLLIQCNGMLVLTLSPI
ncbi:hypothetical protein ACHWQZ_G001530 [Mnemiopsis leidyi]